MPVLNCILDNLAGHPATKPIPKVNTGRGLPVRSLLPVQAPIIPDPVGELKSNLGGTLRNLSEDMLGSLPSSPVNSPTIERYPEREGVPERLKDRGYGYGLYEVTVSLWNGVEGSPPVTTKFQEKGPVFGVGYGKEVFDENRKFIGFSRYGLKMGFGTNTPFVRSGFGGFYSASDLSGNEQTVNVINIEPVGQEKENRSPILLQRERNPDREKPIALLLEPINLDPSSAIPPLPTAEPLEPNYNPFERPKEEENPLSPSVDPPSVRPIVPGTIPPNNPIQNPPGRDRDDPLLPGLHPDKKPTFPTRRLPSPLGISGAPSGGTTSPPNVRPLVPRSPDDFKIPSVNPDTLGEVKNIIPEPEPCQCQGLSKEEDYVIARYKSLNVPVIVQEGIPPNAIAVEKQIKVSIIEIKGISNASDTIQQYRQRADLQKKAIENLNKSAQNFSVLNFLRGFLVPLNTALVFFLNVQFPTFISATNATLDILQTIANKTLSTVNAIVNNSFVQKAINVMNLIASMTILMNLTRDVGETLADMTQLVARSLGFKLTKIDEDGNEIEIQLWDAVSGTVNGIIQSIIGAENLAAIQVKIASLNRIYHAASSVIDSTMDFFNTTWRLAEITVGNIGRIGNALRASGQVFQNAYDTMEETFWGSRTQRFQRITKFYEKVEDTADIASGVASTKIAVGEAKKEITETVNELNQTVEENRKNVEEKILQQKEQSRIETNLGDLKIGKLE